VSSQFVVRRGDVTDARILLDLFDGAIAWMVSRNATEQWGSTPFSQVPARVETIEKWAASGGLRIGEHREHPGRPAAAMVLGVAQPYVSPTTEPELYVVVLIGSREPFARGAGRHLLRVAEQEAREQDLGRLRVDCFAGNDGALVRFYESCGFVRTETFTVRDWPGQVLERRLSDRSSTPA
jgi:GNAT superfamily N-acetyltransferase